MPCTQAAFQVLACLASSHIAPPRFLDAQWAPTHLCWCASTPATYVIAVTSMSDRRNGQESPVPQTSDNLKLRYRTAVLSRALLNRHDELLGTSLLAPPSKCLHGLAPRALPQEDHELATPLKRRTLEHGQQQRASVGLMRPVAGHGLCCVPCQDLRNGSERPRSCGSGAQSSPKPD